MTSPTPPRHPGPHDGPGGEPGEPTGPGGRQAAPGTSSVPARTGRNPVAWWGFGLAFGSVLSAVAGAALALSVLGVVVARRTGRALVPAIVGCVIATLALGAHAVVGTIGAVQRVTAAVAEDDVTGTEDDDGTAGGGSGPDEGGSDGEADLTAAEEAYLDALAGLESDTYAVYTDDALLYFGGLACDSLDGGLAPDDAALDLDLMGSAGAEDVVATAGRVLCPVGSAEGADGASADEAGDTSSSGGTTGASASAAGAPRSGATQGA